MGAGVDGICAGASDRERKLELMEHTRAVRSLSAIYVKRLVPNTKNSLIDTTGFATKKNPTF
jgi:hypothetical protein